MNLCHSLWFPTIIHYVDVVFLWLYHIIRSPDSLCRRTLSSLDKSLSWGLRKNIFLSRLSGVSQVIVSLLGCSTPLCCRNLSSLDTVAIAWTLKKNRFFFPTVGSIANSLSFLSYCRVAIPLLSNRLLILCPVAILLASDRPPKSLQLIALWFCVPSQF